MAMTMSSSSKRKSSSTHHSVRLRGLKKNRIFMALPVSLETQSLELCNDLLEGDRRPEDRPSYPLERTGDVLMRASEMNEARLQRDVTPLLVPSAEHLFFSGDTQLHYVGEEIQAEWVRCEAMGSTRPRPDFAVGLRWTAFEDGELGKLENYATPGTPFLFTHNLAFPFLICELKTGQAGMENADLQNIHSGSIAVRAILSLYHAAYGKNHVKARGLLGQILVFSVCHNNEQVNIYGHYAVANNSSNGHDDALENLRYSRHGIALFSLTIGQGKDRFKSHNFIRNLYDKFAPEHLKRIKDAVGHLPSVQPRTGSSFATSDLAMDHESGSQQGSEVSDVQEGSGFRTPGAPASAYFKDEISKMREQMRELVKQLEQQRRDSQEQLEQQKKDSQERLEQQKKDSQELLVRLLGRPAAAV
ncbi:hypothetical protein M8818_006953 [Zalaria obscura]|uniref:Uncharacterized protein n=1 Tax=Zalaria obscura TaxID=2024903 RepID=A0ACC3S5C1_9PEZI